MRHTVSAWIAAISLALVCVSADGGRRPRYGGTLRLDLRAQVRNLEPADLAVDPPEAAAKEKLLQQVFETLVRLDDAGRPQPHLAVEWKHDEARKQWVFVPREGVTFQNGAAWMPAPGTLAFADEIPLDQLLRELSRPQRAITLRATDGSLVGTGPFRVSEFEAGKQIRLTAYEGYWGGRAFPDGVDVRMGRGYPEQAVDLETGQADVIEIPVTEVRRARQRGDIVTMSAPLETLALVFDRTKAPAESVREALALALDRTAIQGVLLQRQGELSAALLPQWLSGYSFVFPTERDLAKARQLAAGSPPLPFRYDRTDPVLRSVAERIALDAAEAGLTLRPGTGEGGVRLVGWRILPTDPYEALNMAATFSGAMPPKRGDPYEREGALLDGRFIIPVAHLPACYALGSRVQGWAGAKWLPSDRWDLGGVWLTEAAR
jgi:peptide/nickel transport system substrate-binding protein